MRCSRQQVNRNEVSLAKRWKEGVSAGGLCRRNVRRTEAKCVHPQPEYSAFQKGTWDDSQFTGSYWLAELHDPHGISDAELGMSRAPSALDAGALKTNVLLSLGSAFACLLPLSTFLFLAHDHTSTSYTTPITFYPSPLFQILTTGNVFLTGLCSFCPSPTTECRRRDYQQKTTSLVDQREWTCSGACPPPRQV